MLSTRTSVNGETRRRFLRSESSRYSSVFVSAAAACVVVILAAAIALVMKRPSGEWLPDTGTAPDGTPTFYTAISGTAEPASLGAIPNRSGDGGPLHSNSSTLWLGSSPEGNMDDSIALLQEQPEPDTESPYTGFSMLPCTNNRLVIVVSSAGISEKDRSGTVFLNVFVDWNRDGRFAGGDRCGREWAVENLPIPASDLKEGPTAFPLDLPAGEQTLEFWIRISVTLNEPALGEKPIHPYKTGETEDILFSALGDSSTHSSPKGCTGSLPIASLGGSTMWIDMSRVNLDRETTAAKRSEVSANFVGEVSSSIAAFVDLPSDTALLTLPEVDSVRYGEALVGGSRCRFLALPRFVPKRAPLAEQLESSKLELGNVGQYARSPDHVAYCLNQYVYAGTATLIPIHMLAAEETILRRHLEDSGTRSPMMSRTSIYVSESGSSLSPTLGPGPSNPNTRVLALAAYTDASGVVRAIQMRVPSQLQGKQYALRLSPTPLDGISISCSLSVIQLPNPQSLEPYSSPTQEEASVPRIAGDYIVAFAKKSDSCGMFDLRFVETVRIRQYGERIEIQRAAGNLSSGQITPPTTFKATGSGKDKAGTAYIESYSVRLVERGFAGSYELHQGACRASFDIDAVAR